jgi:hypothetical protein
MLWWCMKFEMELCSGNYSLWVCACRPAYTSLWKMKERWGTQVVACTATASAVVQRDIEECLHMKNPRCIRMQVVRNNLHICISSKGNSREAEISLARLVKRSSAKRVLVFCCSTSECERTARVLVLNKESAEAYHSRVEDRQEVEARLQAGVMRRVNPVVWCSKQKGRKCRAYRRNESNLCHSRLWSGNGLARSWLDCALGYSYVSASVRPADWAWRAMWVRLSVHNLL